MRLIDADNLISVLDILSDKGGDIRYWEQLKLIVADCPTANVAEVKRGRWISQEYMSEIDSFIYTEYKCSNCGEISKKKSNYCPNCGAKMHK